MKDIVSGEIFQRFPRYIRGVVIARGINNQGESQKLLELLREAEDHAAQDETLSDIKNHPRIANWRQAYSDFGTNPNKFHSSIESLARRAHRGDHVPYINTLVAMFNYFSLKHLIPSGGDDLDRVDGNLCLTLAKGSEPFTPLNQDIVEYPTPGEVIYVDNSRVLCRRWNWRQGDQTKLTPVTTNVVINVDCLPPVTRDECETMTRELANLVRELCAGEVTHCFLDAPQSEIDL